VDAASSEVAARDTDAIVTFCEALAAFPRRGTVRDITPGRRTVGLWAVGQLLGHPIFVTDRLKPRVDLYSALAGQRRLKIRDHQPGCRSWPAHRCDADTALST
jgi:plasmid stabilization system protein ParE